MNESEKYQKLVESWLIEKNLDRFIEVKVLDNPDFKVKDDGLLGTIKKASAPWNVLPSIPDFIVIIKEDVLDQLEMEYGLKYRDFALESIINGISYDAEKDKPVIIKPNIVTYMGLLHKYEYAHYEAVSAALQQLKEKNQEG